MDAVCGGSELFPNYNQTSDSLITGTALHGPPLTPTTMVCYDSALLDTESG